MRAIGYIRVSTREQGESGLGLDAQRASIEAACAARGWELVDVAVDVASGKSTNGRHGLAAAIERIEAGHADALVSSKLDRIARSTLDFAGLLERAGKAGWAVVVLEIDLDTTTAMGRFVATVMAAVAELERGMISERTRAGLAQAKERGTVLGRAKGCHVLPAAVRARIVADRTVGLSYRAIAAGLDGDGIPTAYSGREWSAESVRQVVLRA